MDTAMLTAGFFFDLAAFAHGDIFRDNEWVWEPLKRLDDYLEAWFRSTPAGIHGQVSDTARLHGEAIYIGPGTVVEDGATIHGPAIIGADCEIRQGAYIRGNAVIGDRCVLGHASELKHSIMLDDAKAPHFAYVGDSILGNDVNLGAGTKLSNLTVSSIKDQQTGSRPTIHLLIDDNRVDTGLAKLGAILGDHVQTGCNAVTNPGTLIGKNTLVYPNTSVSKGYVVENSIVKLRQALTVVPRDQVG